ncbi:MAG: hypothetical protein ACI3U2_00975 [Anaerovibrio sp.]
MVIIFYVIVASQGSNTLPIGTILPYVGNLSDIPHGWALCDGTNGTPNLTGRFLQGWGWDDFYNRNVGEYVQEGLPNIWGTSDSNTDFNSLGGAFWGSNYNNSPDCGGRNGYHGFNFDASRCSWVYGNSSTVQPRSYVVYYIMRII